MNEKYRYLVNLIFEFEHDGKTTKTNEQWLINAISVSDAETKANKEISKMTIIASTMVCRIKDVKETKIVKVIE